MKTSAGLLALLAVAAGCAPPQRRGAAHAEAFVRDSVGRVRAPETRVRDTLKLQARVAYTDAWLTCRNRLDVRWAVRRAQEAYVDTMTYEQITRVTDADALGLVMAVDEQHCGPRPPS